LDLFWALLIEDQSIALKLTRMPDNPIKNHTRAKMILRLLLFVSPEIIGMGMIELIRQSKTFSTPNWVAIFFGSLVIYTLSLGSQILTKPDGERRKNSGWNAAAFVIIHAIFMPNILMGICLHGI
jgi:hypothetical protein